MPKHTPGPWLVDMDANIMAGELRIGYVTGESESGDFTVADEANARLIAAAPDMLAILQRLLELNRDGRVMARCWGEAEAAVSKATV